MKSNPIVDKTLKFSLQIINFTKDIDKSPQGIVISKQIIRSGTSIGANVVEAQDASSKKEFAQKLSISLREAKETMYWLSLIELGGLTRRRIDEERNQLNEIIAMLTSIVRSARRNC